MAGVGMGFTFDATDYGRVSNMHHGGVILWHIIEKALSQQHLGISPILYTTPRATVLHNPRDSPCKRALALFKTNNDSSRQTTVF